MPYPKDGGDAPGPSTRFPDVEREILAFWAEDGTFQASIDRREGAPEWVFYDGPPFANGLPHYGHLLTGYAKDAFPRFQTMRGKQVHRRFGWDTHGLPAELEAMRQLGITTKDEIEQMGVGAFNAAARASVLQYTGEWQDHVTRQARWVDFEHDYKTLDPSFMESVLWAFKTLHDKGLAYEGFRVLPYCWNDETPLSNHELRMDDDVYQRRQDPSVTVTFPLVGEKAEALGLTAVRALAWTTTPWTLPTNLALAVGPEIEYAVVPSGPLGTADAETAPGAEVLGADYLLAAARVGDHAKELGYASAADAVAAVSRVLPGRDLQDVHYDRLWDTYADSGVWGTERAWRVLVADYVSTEEGTGVVHQAPAYGEDDQLISTAAGIPTILSVDEKARFLPMFAGTELAGIAGVQVFEANRTLIRALKAKGRLLREASYEHAYPHCWRCRKPLIYKAVSSWFVRVTDYRDRMVELNRGITWVPENVKDGQFGKWLAGARDWSISRNRYWGSPIPVWRSDDPEHPRTDVYGSLAQLEADFGRLPRNEDGEVDLHRPFIDELTRPNPDDPTGASTMRRIEDVFDVWFDSGSMPYAQVHYPFQEQEWFDGVDGQRGHNPADFIVEYIGQTRGWFYTMHALATPLFDRPAFSTVVSHGIVLGNDGQKMSKSLRNYPDVSEVFDRDGSDAMRWFLLASPVLRGGNLVVTEEGIREGVRQVLLPLWSSYYFFTLYAGAEDVEATWRTDSPNRNDRHVLAAARALVTRVGAQLEAFDTAGAALSLREFMDLVTNGYVRRNRDRFWAARAPGEPLAQDSVDAFDTLHTVLETVCRVAAPLLPLVAEKVWRGLTGGRSVHLTDWPDATAFPEDAELLARFERVHEVVSTALALRKQAGKRVRLPLPRLTVVAADADAVAADGAALLAEELNVKAVDVLPEDDGAAARFGVSQRLSVNARALGPRIGRRVQQVIAAAKAGDWRQRDGQVEVGGVPLLDGEYELVLERAGGGQDDALGLLPGGGFVLLETATTPELEQEGHARDFVRDVQQARRAAGFDVSDRIELVVEGDPDLVAMLETHGGLVAGETLAASLDVLPNGPGTTGNVLRWPDGHVVHLAAGSWGASGAGARFELRRSGGSPLDV